MPFLGHLYLLELVRVELDPTSVVILEIFEGCVGP